MPKPTKISAKPEKKRLALFLDGTRNTSGDNTNVWRLKALCADRSTDGLQQMAYYNTGVGTRFGEKVRGAALGYGLNKLVSDAYEWLIDNYNAEDEIFIFGFSRGAYTARSLAGFIAICGLLRPGSPLGVNQLYDRYRTGDEDRTIWKLLQIARGEIKGVLSFEEEWMVKHSAAVKIKLVAIFDTVGALGMAAFNIPGLSASTYEYLHTGLRRPIQHGFHVLAIDEHRRKFTPTIWTIRTPPGEDVAKRMASRAIESVEQRWFVGAHANVGGGYPSDLLAQVPLRWIMSKASLHGLSFRKDVELDGDLLKAEISDSYRKFMRGIYRGFSWRNYRPIGEPPRVGADGTHSNVNETIDATVFDRWRQVPNYRPPNLAEWASRYNVKIENLDKAVRADNPTVAAPD